MMQQVLGTMLTLISLHFQYGNWPSMLSCTFRVENKFSSAQMMDVVVEQMSCS